MDIKKLYPDIKRNPYYIVAPPYTTQSAGIKALHLLCHALNKFGQSAFMIIHPEFNGGMSTNPELLTPMLTQGVIDYHFRKKCTPIVVYPETINGNPFGAQSVVRYILNFPGLLGGDRKYSRDEICFGYSKVLADSHCHSDNVLFIPTVDTSIFYPTNYKAVRSGSCFFASKYKAVHNGELLPITADSIEIIRNKSDSQTPEQIADIFRRSEVFYTYENTALAAEALLCGCPTVFIPNPYLSDPIALYEIGNDGIAWGTDPAEIARAKATIARGPENYFRTYDLFWNQLKEFIDITQDAVCNITYTGKIYVPYVKYLGEIDYGIKYVIDLMAIRKNEGYKGLLLRAFKKTRRYFHNIRKIIYWPR